MKPSHYEALKREIEVTLYKLLKKHGLSKKDTFKYRVEFRLDDDTNELVFLKNERAGRRMEETFKLVKED